jgi:hypothetical protein
MCIYCGTNHYRKIYQNHFGPIPKDEIGKTYDIHHVDNDHLNNPNNLKAITIQEHYEIHLAQGDYKVCHAIGLHIKLPPGKMSELAKFNALARITNGTHSFVINNNELTNNRVKNGTHNFLDGELSRKTNRNRINNGTHQFIQNLLAHIVIR